MNDDDVPARDQTQSRLLVSELRHPRLFEAARKGIPIFDAVTLRITDVNPFMTELRGYSHVEFSGKELWETGLFSNKEASHICSPTVSSINELISAAIFLAE